MNEAKKIQKEIGEKSESFSKLEIISAYVADFSSWTVSSRKLKLDTNEGLIDKKSIQFFWKIKTIFIFFFLNYR